MPLLRVLCYCLLFFSAQASSASYPSLNYDLLASESFPPQMFTQGLVKAGPWFYISSGLYGKSKVLKYDPQHPQPHVQWRLPRRQFAEGITLLHDKLYLLSWKSGRAWQLNNETLEPEQRLTIEGEGWGITHNGETLITSDGSDHLTFRHPQDMRVIHSLKITDQGQPLYNLNELEFANGVIWANIWKQTRIVAIDPANGKVIADIDLTDLIKPYHHVRSGKVLNGIAWDDKAQGLWITGKYWPKMFLIKPAASNWQH